jgi:hypothetical protein
MAIPRESIPQHVRRCYEMARKANERNRKAEIERLKFYVGGDHQWRDEEITRRENSQRPHITINKCKPAVDQVEGDIRLNPPGPQTHPVGEGADADTADIIDGLIRETEYRSVARTAYSTAGKYSAASGYAVLELETEFESERSFSQRPRINSVEDPNQVFFDPTSRMPNREDAGFAGKIRLYNRGEYIARFGERRRVLQPRMFQSAAGWLADALGTESSVMYEWMGDPKAGPYVVCEFSMLELKPAKLRLYSDNIARFDGENVPRGVKPVEGKENVREVQKRTYKLYTVDALEVLDETEWPGTMHKWIPVLGPEVYIDGKLHRLSLISGALDAQRGLNFCATTITEIGGTMTKAPWIGWEGQFDDPRWQSANRELWAYLEVKAKFATDEAGNQHLLPAPQRNVWEAPIQWLLASCQFFSDAIKAVTAIYDPSLGQQKGDQSGKAIEQLRSESSVGNFSYADNLHRAVGLMYNQLVVLFQALYDGERVKTIVRPDSQHEIMTINRMFPEDGIDPATGKKGKRNDITTGQYSVRVVVGKDFETRNDDAINTFIEFLKIDPQIIAAPGVAGKALRWIAQGNPQIEGIADMLDPQQQDGEASPQALQGQLQKAQQQGQMMMQVIQKMNQEIQAKLPQIEADKWKTMVDNLTKIRVAEINASKDADHQSADLDAAHLEQVLQMAHESASAAQQRQHEAQQQQVQQSADVASQESQQAHATQSQQADLESAQNSEEGQSQ